MEGSHSSWLPILTPMDYAGHRARRMGPGWRLSQFLFLSLSAEVARSSSIVTNGYPLVGV